MEELSILRTFAAATTVLAAALVAANVNARITVAILLLVNAFGVWLALVSRGREGG
jgi:hypothetical protein